MTLRRFHIVLSLLILFSSSILSQTKFIKEFYDDDISKKYLVEQWTTDNGLPQNSINDITQTKDGFLWLATEEGVVRFDGENFSYFNVSNSPGLKFNRIKSLQADEKGGLWIGGENGNVAYLINKSVRDLSDKFHKYLGSVYKIDISENGTIWIGAGNSLLKSNGEKFKIIYSAPKKYIAFNDLLIMNNNKVIFSTGEGIFLTDSSGNITNLYKTSSADVLRPFSENKILIAEDNQLKLFSLKTHKIVKVLSKKRDLNSYGKLLVDKNKNIWWGSIHFGLYVIISGNNEVKFNQENLNKGYVTSFFEDNSGNIWIGTGTKGLFKLSERYFYGISLFNGYFNDIISQIYQARDGSIWVGANCGGVAEIKDSEINYYFDGSGSLKQGCVWSIFEKEDGTKYFGTYNFGIYKFDPSSNKSVSLPGSVSALTFMEDGDSLWAAGVYGLYVIKNDSAFIFKSKNFPENSWFNTIVKDKNGILWLGGKKGLYKYNGDDFEAVTLLDGGTETPVRPIYFDENNRMFVGTYGYGLFVYDSGNFINIKMKDGLFDNTIHTIFEDFRHNFWMTSNHGIFIVKKKDILSFVKDNSSKISSKVFTKKLGFPNNEFNGGFQPAHLYLEDGTLLLPTLEGIVAVDINNISLEGKQPNVYIDDFLVDGKACQTNKEIIVKAGFGDIEIKFTAIDLSGGGVQFKYKIDGLDEGWSRPTNERYIVLKSIPPGEYVFKVKARKSLSSWGASSKELRFVVEPKFYQLVVFKILVVFLFMFLVVGIALIYMNIQRRMAQRLVKIVKQRTKELQAEIIKKENVLNELEIAKEDEKRHRKLAEKLNRDKTEMFRIISHNLKNPIGVIRSSANLINEESVDESVQKELSDIIIKASNEALGGIEEILHHSEVEDLEFKLSLSEFNLNDLVQKVVTRNLNVAKDKNQTILFDKNAGGKFLISADYEKLFLAIENYLSNAIKYSPIGKEIKIKIQSEGDRIYFSVTDKGPGITEEDKKNLFGKFQKLSARPTGNESSSGLGLAIVKRIIELHKGEFGVISENAGNGSEFFFIIPKVQ